MRSLRPRPCGAIFLSVAGVLMGLPPARAADSPATTAATATAAAAPRSSTSDWPDASTWARVSSLDAWHGPGHWRLVVSPVSHHWRYSAEHTSVIALGVERQYDDRWLLGGSAFRNSFGQSSAYVYLGQRHDGIWQTPPLFFQWSAGIMYGYVGKYQSKVPLNFGGFSPGALVSLGWQFNREASVAVHALGDAGVMLQFAYDFR